MQTLSVQAKIIKAEITPQDRYNFCLDIIKQVMFPKQTNGAPHVQELSQQGQSQADPAITALECCNFLTQQKALG